MSDEPTIHDLPTEEPASPETWTMPEPIFRTSAGKSLRKTDLDLIADEIDTEIANRPDDELVKTTRDKAEAEVKPLPASGQAKKGGCAQSFLMTLGMVVLITAVLVAALVYFLVSYRPTETGTF